MKIMSQRLSVIAALAGLVSISFAQMASAHVVVKPAETVTSGFITFDAGVPNEKETPVTKLKLVIPKGLKYVQPAVKNGWTVTTEKDGNGLDATVTSITWENGAIPAGFRDDFAFSAQVPASATELQWKAYQTYEDGSVVSWDQANESESDTKGPFSVTKVVAKSQSDSAVAAASSASDSAKSTSQTAVYLSVASLIVSFAAIYLALKKRS